MTCRVTWLVFHGVTLLFRSLTQDFILVFALDSRQTAWERCIECHSCPPKFSFDVLLRSLVRQKPKALQPHVAAKRCFIQSGMLLCRLLEAFGNLKLLKGPVQVCLVYLHTKPRPYHRSICVPKRAVAQANSDLELSPKTKKHKLKCEHTLQ